MNTHESNDQRAHYSKKRPQTFRRPRSIVNGISARQYARVEAVARMIDLLDLLEEDCDLEADTDCCTAGDDVLTASSCLLGGKGDHGAYDPDQEWSAAGAEL